MSADNESSVVSAAASADRESTEAGMGMPGTLSGGLGVSLPAAPFTPTRAIVRAGYVAITTEADSSVTEAEAGAEFDRWLAEVKAEAWDVCVKSAHLRENESRYWVEHKRNPYRTP